MAPANGDDPAGFGGVDRRALITRAAAVGAAAWTAPVIIGSIASPAGATTLVGCYRAQFDNTSNTCGSTSTVVEVVPDQGSGCLEPNIWNAQADLPFGLVTLVTATEKANGDCEYQFVIGGGCRFDERSNARKDQGNRCNTAAQATFLSNCTAVVFTLDFVPDRFKFLVVCGGAGPCQGGTECSLNQ
jgi:hypothetical protein